MPNRDCRWSELIDERHGLQRTPTSDFDSPIEGMNGMKSRRGETKRIVVGIGVSIRGLLPEDKVRVVDYPKWRRVFGQNIGSSSFYRSPSLAARCMVMPALN
jgi:hypothetical protein